MVEYRLVKTEWGILAYALRQGKVIKVFLPPAAPKGLMGKSEVLLQVRRQISAVHAFADGIGQEAVENATLLETLAEKLCRYFEGQRVDFCVDDCDLTGQSGFAKDVLLAAAGVSHGQVRSYREIAEQIGKPGAFRAVAGALGANPFPIVIPCHRIIYTNGKLGGYSGADGVEFKRRLLELEKAEICLSV